MRRSRRTAGRRRHRASGGGGAVSARRLLGAHLPAAYPERRGDGGGGVPGLRDAVRHRRAAAAAGGVPGLRCRRARPRGHRGAAAAEAVQRVADPEDGTMTLRFIVSRVLRGSRSSWPNVTRTRSWSTRCTTRPMPRHRRRRTEGVLETRGPGPGLRRLATFRRAERQVGAGRDRDCAFGRSWPCRWGRTSSVCGR